MEVFLLAAGLGTRLRPLTNDRPKALVNLGDISILEFNIKNLIAQGATKIIINIHHFGEQIIDFISSRKWEVEIAISDERKLLLDTGGGLKYASNLFSKHEPILIHNVDILSEIKFNDLIATFNQSDDIATLAVSQRDTSRYLLFDEKQKLIGWHNTKTNKFLWSKEGINRYNAYAFSGIAMIQPQLLDLLPPPIAPYPIIPEYLKIAANHTIGCYKHDASKWIDVGKPETLKKATLWYNQKSKNNK